jgi:flavin-dependent dehydrogenase
MAEQVDILVIGAGPSGAVAAAIVAKQGLKVKVVEKETFPRFVIGESLIPLVMEPLEEAGFLPVLMEQGYQKKFGARFIKNGKVCEFDFAEQFTPGWTWTWQLPRAHFDKCLTDQLLDRGIDIAFGTTVTGIEFNGTDSVTTIVDSTGNVNQIAAKYIIDASGYGRVIPRLFNLDKPSVQPSRTGMFVHVKDINRPAGREGEQITFVVVRQDVWMWVIPFSDGITSVGFVGNTDFINRYEGTPEERIRLMIGDEEYYAERLRDVPFLFEPKSINGYSSSVKKLYGEGFALTGNSAEFLDPVFSSGVAFALEGGRLAAKLACRQVKGETIDWQTDFHDYMYLGVEAFRTYVMAWYDGTLQDIFFSDLNNQKFKQQICSVLAGYVWDQSNPFVRKHRKAVYKLAEVLNTIGTD